MGAQQRVFRRRIRSVQATKKITKAMELIASSRIVKAQQRLDASLPYLQSKHPLMANPENRSKAAVLVVTADRGLAGAYSANTLREAEGLYANLRNAGVTAIPFVVGRKGVAYYKFRERAVGGEYTGFTDQPTYSDAKRIGEDLLNAFLTPAEEGGVDEIHIVYTHFVNMGTQEVRIRRVLPHEVVDEVIEKDSAMPFPLYEFEPEAETVLDGLLPQYIQHSVYSALLMSAASEHAARRRAMKSATDNAEDLIRTLTRQANQARQAEITQEISEIVGGADALAAS